MFQDNWFSISLIDKFGTKKSYPEIKIKFVT